MLNVEVLEACIPLGVFRQVITVATVEVFSNKGVYCGLLIEEVEQIVRVDLPFGHIILTIGTCSLVVFIRKLVIRMVVLGRRFFFTIFTISTEACLILLLKVYFMSIFVYKF